MGDGVKLLDVSWFGDTDGVGAGHERGSGDSADGLGVEIGELQSFGRHLIDAGRFDCFRAEAAEVFVALVIGEDEDDVGFLRACTAALVRSEGKC